MSNISDPPHLRKLSHILLWDRFYVVLIAVLLFAFSLAHDHLWILFLIYTIWFRKHMHLGLLAVAVIMLSLRFYVWHLNIPKQIIKDEVVITAIEETLYQDRITFRYKGYLVHAYVKPELYSLGQRLIIEAEITPYKKQTTPFGFDAFAFYRSSNVIGYTKNLSIEEVINRSSFIDLRHQMLTNINQYAHGNYLKKLFFNVDEMPTDTKALYRQTGVWFLLGISGIHMSVVMTMVQKGLFHLNTKANHQSYVFIALYLSLLYISLGSWVIYRLFLLYIMTEVMTYFKISMPKSERILCVYICLLFLFPHLIYHYGVIISLVLLLALSFFQIRFAQMHPLPAMFYRGMLISILLIFFSSTIRPINMILMPILILLFSWILFPWIVISLFLPYLDQVVFALMTAFEALLILIEIKMFAFDLPHYPLWFSLILIYLAIKIFYFDCSVKRFKYGILLFILMCLPYMRGQLITSEVIFLDAEQGDSTIIRHGGCLVVIDAYQNVTRTLKGYGITSIDYLILTHHHIDHIKESEMLLDTFEVKNLVLNPYDEYDIKHSRTIYAKQGDKILCKGLHLDILGPIKNYHNANNNSLVITFSIQDTKFLFAGDIEFEAEVDLISHYQNNLKSDVLKVPHHGSKTSSHETFIMAVSPSFAVISLKANNRYGFPHIEVINRYLQKGILMYQTDLNGSVVYQVVFKREKWRFYMPY